MRILNKNPVGDFGLKHASPGAEKYYWGMELALVSITPAARPPRLVVNNVRKAAISTNTFSL